MLELFTQKEALIALAGAMLYPAWAFIRKHLLPALAVSAVFWLAKKTLPAMKTALVKAFRNWPTAWPAFVFALAVLVSFLLTACSSVPSREELNSTDQVIHNAAGSNGCSMSREELIECKRNLASCDPQDPRTKYLDCTDGMKDTVFFINPFFHYRR